ncbi:MAG: hypothetical protein AAGJ46_04190 [Planctomycetota bacterium]
MVIEREIESFLGWLLQGDKWYQAALIQFLATAGAVALVGIALGFLVQLVRHGPVRAGETIYRSLSTGVVELSRTSWRRVSALAGLAVKESLRRRVWVALVVFIAILLFAGWFLSTNHQDPVKLYLSVVLTATSFMSLLLALLISTFSLPGEFKSKTIYTLVTKPVRSGDIVLGRILGFTAVGTVLLALMAICSYVFVTRSLDHTHDVAAETLTDDTIEGEVIGASGETTITQGHRHAVSLGPDGDGLAIAAHGHDHVIEAGGEVQVTSSPTGLLRARVPQRGKLRFLDRNGVPKERGVSVGNEWGYRSFIEGGTRAAAIWKFSGINENTLDTSGDTRVLPIELLVRVFRTHKGEITRPIQGSVQLRNPETKQVNSIQLFGARDGQLDLFEFPVEQFDTDRNEINQLDDLVSESGELEVIVQPLERAQYYGFAQADCYIRLPEDNPFWNFVKGYLSIWVQMVVVIAIGVTASTFLNGPIAMLFTTSFVLLGFFRGFLIGIATGVQPNGDKVYGGGPVEALVRIVTQMNLTTQFDTDTQSQAIGVSLMKGADDVVQFVIEKIAYVLPDFRTLSSVNYVAEGFSIPSPVIGRELAIAAAYIIGLSIAGYFFLRSREVAKA